MKHGGPRRGAGRPATGKTGKTVTFNCHQDNINNVKELSSRNILSKTINHLLTKHCKDG